MTKKRKRVSRLERAKQKREVKQALVYLGLTIILVVVLFIWGIPALARMAGFLSKDETTPNLVNQNTIPLTAPFLRNIPEATNSATLEINGTAESGSEVEIYLNNLKVDKVIADKEGDFSSKLELNEGENWLYAQAKRGKEVSPKSKEYQILLDTQPPTITITSPEEGKTEFNGDEEQIITIAGEVDEEIEEAMVGDRIAIVEDGKKFKADYSLNEGENTIEVVVRDKAGNEAKTELHLTWRP